MRNLSLLWLVCLFNVGGGVEEASGAFGRTEGRDCEENWIGGDDDG